MALSDRKLKILEAIITDYIETAEPIGSRTIAKKYDLGISPATIRNEMSDLEEMGLIEQPHTSAGRIPSDKGYRLYVDNMMQSSSGLSGSQAEYLAKAINYNVTKIEYLMQQTAKAISMLTNYTAVVSEPVDNQVKVKHIQLVPVDERSIVAVIVTSDNTVKNSVIKIKTMPDTNTLAQISRSINSLISNVSLEEINREFAAAVFDVFPEYQETIAKVLKVVISDLRHNRDVHLYTSGVRNMLGFPEFNDLDKIKNIFQTFEEKEMLVSLLGNEDNPAMGYRAIRICLKQPEIFKTQLRALLRAAVYGNLSIMYPMITSTEEVKKIYEIVAEVEEELKAQEIQYKIPEQGIMIETPAAAIISDRLAEMVDFFSIGTNDLTQYTLAIDRQNEKLDEFYNPHHEALLRMIQMVVDNAHKCGKWAGICGELGADTTLTEEFVRMGLDELSVAPSMVLKLRKIVREMKVEG